MKITNEELGRIFIAFGTALQQAGADTPVSNQEPPSTPAAEPEQLSGVFTEPPPEPQMNTQALQQDNTSALRIAELERQLAAANNKPNQSGLDLKPITL